MLLSTPGTRCAPAGSPLDPLFPQEYRKLVPINFAYQGRLQEVINQDRENNVKKPFSPDKLSGKKQGD
ncbi:hypothetical protein [Peribacillus sp. NPDC060253]|uniref:hypothetical protein n=1 Tax=Peribacillus sp. NPDC060253 TaxID=3347084 RepID=UPI003648F2FD